MALLAKSGWDRGPTAGRRLLSFALLGGLLAGALVLRQARALAEGESESAPEYAVKAAFLLNFARFVEWPEGSFAEPRSPLVIAVLGDDPFGPQLEGTLGGKTVEEHPLEIRRWKTLPSKETCHILFVSQSEKDRVERVLSRVKGWKALTVSEVDGFARRGGIFRLFLRENRVCFEVNVDAAARAGFKISSKLLRVGDVIHDGEGGR